ncbi:MAG: xanthine dehydrogenase accessory factor [Clostridia bacterium]|nr:xanthine dehydrogenase accessory factor [Clostridia bacterium]
MLVLVRGAGDLASAVCHRLMQSGFDVIATEIEQPTMVRRTVSFAEAVYTGEWEVEGIKGVRIQTVDEAKDQIKRGNLPVLVDPGLKCLKELSPEAVVDAILAKKNLGTHREMAAVVIGLGPGFYAGKDVHAVVETMRGHYLGRVIYEGEATPNTGVPGEVGGYSIKRLVKSPVPGIVKANKKIGEMVSEGETVCYVGDVPVIAQISGVVRGLIKEGLIVKENMKIGDIDPRCEKQHCFTISDKARAVAGGVLEAILHLSGVIKKL